jgi:uncharacterized membrane protein
LSSNVARGRTAASDKPFITWRRALNIAWRTAHIGVAGVLVGGHVFDVDRNRLHLWLYLTIVSGAVLIVLEAYPRWRWLHEGRGVLTILKLLLLSLVPWLWAYRAWLLAAVIVLASVGSHMPARFRYRSLWSGRMPDDSESIR